jgi:hypothetical protein
MQFHTYKQTFINGISNLPFNIFIGLFFLLISILGIIGFIVKKRIITQSFWKLFLYVSIGCGIYLELTALGLYKSVLDGRSMVVTIVSWFVFLLIDFILYIPMYRALFLYGYRSDDLWKFNE